MNRPEPVLRLRCPRDVDPDQSDLHIAVEVRLPLTFDAFAFVGMRLSMCSCGAQMVTAAASIAKPATKRAVLTVVAPAGAVFLYDARWPCADDPRDVMAEAQAEARGAAADRGLRATSFFSILLTLPGGHTLGRRVNDRGEWEEDGADQTTAPR